MTPSDNKSTIPCVVTFAEASSVNEDSNTKGMFRQAPEATIAQVDIASLRDSLTSMGSLINSILDDIPDSTDGFRATAATVSFEITASGKFAICGTGVEAGAKGGLSVTFQRDTVK